MKIKIILDVAWKILKIFSIFAEKDRLTEKMEKVEDKFKGKGD